MQEIGIKEGGKCLLKKGVFSGAYSICVRYHLDSTSENVDVVFTHLHLLMATNKVTIYNKKITFFSWVL